MAEVCTYGGDAGAPINGFIDFPYDDVHCCNYLEVDRGAPYGSVTEVQWTTKLSFAAFDVGRLIAGWPWGLAMMGDRRVNIFIPGNVGGSIGFIGNAPSEVPVPGLTTNEDVWIRGKVNISTSVCEYWYSYDPTYVEEEVTFIPLGNAQIGPTGTPTINSQITFYGNSALIGFEVYGFGGRMYTMSEMVDGVYTMVMRNENIPDDTHSSFALTLGGTADVHRSGVEPDTFLSAYSSDGSTYGMGHYGLCDQGPTRSCSPARAGEVPLATGTPYSPDCEVVTCG